ncbi:unnamed protein product, partial [Rotaria sordida]
ATYDNPGEIEASIENQWGKHYTTYTEYGRKVYYLYDKYIAKEIIEDIEMLQLSNSTTVFQLGSTLFMKTWKMNNKQENQSILNFLNYFGNEWLKSNDDWYKELWTLSYQWAKSTKEIICISNNSSKIYYISARDLQSITQADLTKYKNKTWTTFNQFKKLFDIWCMEMENNSDWKKSKCNCPLFFKNYIYKHIVGMVIRLKCCKPPLAAKIVPH